MRARTISFCCRWLTRCLATHFDRRANEKILLVSAFSSKQEEWFDLECVNVHDGKRYKMVNCRKNANISHNVVFPSPDGSECKADTVGLLKLAHIVAGKIRYIGKETDRKWEEGDDISVLEIRCEPNTAGRKR